MGDHRFGPGKRLFIAAALLASTIGGAFSATAAKELKYDVLQIGTRSFTNATVSVGKSERYLFVSHSAGLESIKRSEVPLDLQAQVGFTMPKQKTNVVLNWTKTQTAAIGNPILNPDEISALKKEIEAQVPAIISKDYRPNWWVVGGISAALVLTWLLVSLCCSQICRKAGSEPGPLVWIPVLQVFPLVKAAGMSAGWGLLWLVPVINCVAYALWCFRIVKARQKSPAVVALLLVPAVNLLGLLYLAMSGSVDAKNETPKRRPQLVTLGAT